MEKSNAPVNLQFWATGRMVGQTLHEGHYYTRVLCPAATLYDQPSTIEVRSDKPIGIEGQEVTVLCRLDGFAQKPKTVVDPMTGKASQRVFVMHFVRAVE